MSDTEVLGFAQALEGALASTYAAVGPLLGQERRAMAAQFGDHHRQHADAFGRVADTDRRPETNERLLAELEPMVRGAVAGGETAILELLQMLENEVAYTHASALASLGDPVPAALAATILPVETQHAAALGLALNLSVAAQFPTGAFEADDVGTLADPRTGIDPRLYG